MQGYLARKRLAFSSPGFLVLLLFASPVLAGPEGATTAKVESTADSVCRLIDSSARDQNLPPAFLTRLIWQESSFRPNVSSPAGAQGIAQFMPRTAGERGLANPFDPEEAIPKAAELLAELKRRFGNLGLAAAAYNAGPTRVANWLADQGSLPAETRDYVLAITGHPVGDWIGGDTASATTSEAPTPSGQSCLQAVAAVRRAEPADFARSAFVAPWGVQLAGSFSKEAALASFARTQRSYSSILGNVEPMILGGRIRSRGFQPYYNIRAPAPTRAAANALCDKILRVGGACVVLRN
jgi:hypothetical protein